MIQMLGWVHMASARSSNATRSLWWLGAPGSDVVVTAAQILYEGVAGGELGSNPTTRSSS